MNAESKIEENKPTAPRIMVAVPTRGDVTIQTVLSLYNMCNHTKLETFIYASTGFIVPENRSRCVAAAWQEKATHILWVDSDMGFPPWSLDQLMNWNVPIVGVNYSMKSIPPRPTAYIETDDYTGPLYTEEGQTGCEPVKWMGFGLCLTHIGVFNKLFEMKDGQPPFFHFNPTKDGFQWSTEDVYFSSRCEKAGIPRYIDHGLSQFVQHVGPFCYTNRAAIYGRNISKERSKKPGEGSVGFTEEDVAPEDSLLTDIPV